MRLAPDIFRHTFATYYVALTGSPSHAAKVLVHSNLGMLARHYDGVATRPEAVRFFGYGLPPVTDVAGELIYAPPSGR